MQTGLLLLQSVASSALRSGRGTSSCAAVAAAGRRQWSENFRPGKPGAALFIAAAGVVATGVAGATVASSSSPAMCSNISSNDEKCHEAVTTKTSGPSSTAMTAAAATATTSTTKIKSIDVPDNTPEHNPLLPFPESSLRYDTYNGVTLDLTTIIETTQQQKQFTDADAFGIKLTHALTIWTTEQRKGIWLKIPTSHSHLVAPATLQGFDFQHAETGYCVLTKWLPPNSESRLPNGPTHQVGVGALVVHPRTGKMLAVQERSGPAAKHKLWKMPTGLTDPGEDVAEAAVRELKEETGLDCVFDRIICIRQAHGGLFGRSDMFFVCLCKLAPECEERIRVGGEVELLPQEEEILMVDWIEMEDYAEQLLWQQSPLYKVMNDAMFRAARSGFSVSSSGDETANCSKNSDDDYSEESHGFVAKNLPVGYRPGNITIYVSSKL
mmetsp:Transcript_10369/g.19080  ORF Transcript_10369/g.19080 Transcript_10369/m.19080 type:complete len:439 (-) Transcript_10369:615-1931(-)